jgi:hypothetical protein
VQFLKAIFALDRLLRRVPSIIEIWFFEFLFLMALGLGVGRLLDGLGVGGCPPAAGSVDGTAFGFIGFGTLMGIPVLIRILRPKVKEVTWTPVFVAHNVAGLSHLPVAMTRPTVTYRVLSSHPSYAFVNLLTLPIPIVMLLGAAGHGCSLSHFRPMGMVILLLMLLLILLRMVAWYGLRLGRGRIEATLPPGWSAEQLEWEFGWKPLLGMIVLMAAVFGVVSFLAWLTT